MADNIKTGSILIEEGALLPESFWLESEPYSNGWRLVKDLDAYGLDRKIREAGWTFFYMAGEVHATAVGSDLEKTRRRAIKRILAKRQSAKFNCLEITQAATKRFLGLPYVSVSAHWRHIQESLVLFQADRLAEWDGVNLPLAQAKPHKGGNYVSKKWRQSPVWPAAKAQNPRAEAYSRIAEGTGKQNDKANKFGALR